MYSGRVGISCASNDTCCFANLSFYMAYALELERGMLNSTSNNMSGVWENKVQMFKVIQNKKYSSS